MNVGFETCKRNKQKSGFFRRKCHTYLREIVSFMEEEMVSVGRLQGDYFNDQFRGVCGSPIDVETGEKDS